MTSDHKRILYAAFTVTVWLLLAYAALDLLAVTRYLSNSKIDFDTLSLVQLLANNLRDVALIVGLSVGGVHIAAQSHDGRAISLPAILIEQIKRNGYLQLWSLGLLIVLASCLISAENTLLYVGYPLMTVPIAFWLMTRFSNVSEFWARRGMRNIYLMVAVAGILINMTLWLQLGVIALLAVPVAYGIFAAHSYRAFSDRNPSQTLAAHWAALGIVHLLGAALLVNMVLLADVEPFTAGTSWHHTQFDITYFGWIAWLLALINQAVAELRGHNRRITGLLPFWMMATGMIAGGFLLALISMVRSYALHVYNIPADDVFTSLVPLRAIWVGSKIVFALGLGIYGLQYQARRLKR